MLLRTEPFQPAKFEADREMDLRGQHICYHTVCEDTVFYNDDGAPIATIFSYSYFRTNTDDEKNRPVLFCYNGGPGGSSVFVHAGFLGTKRVYYKEDVNAPDGLPPYVSGDNPNCLLDIADIVLVDPVGTGYGMLLDPKYESEFYNSDGDAEALLLFIKQWLAKYHRFHSPKYLVGESYGCTRSAIAAGLANGWGEDRTYSLAFDGIVMIGNTVTVGDYFNKNVPVETSVLMLPTCAAIVWYYNHPADKTLKEFVSEAKHFADTEYLRALYRGDELQGKERQTFVEKLSFYAGVPAEFLEEHGLRFDEWTWRAEFAKQCGKMVSRHDARMTLENVVPQTKTGNRWALDDALTAKYDPIFDAVLQDDILPEMGVQDFKRTFVNSYVEKWKTLDAKKYNTGERLCEAMRRCRGMRVFFANGWYDLCTQIGIVYYTINHAGLPKDRTFLKGYPSGHMLYIGEDNVRELTEDIRTFIEGKTPDGVECV